MCSTRRAAARRRRNFIAPFINLRAPQPLGIVSVAFSPDRNPWLIAYYTAPRPPSGIPVIAYRLSDRAIARTYEQQPTVGQPLTQCRRQKNRRRKNAGIFRRTRQWRIHLILMLAEKNLRKVFTTMALRTQLKPLLAFLVPAILAGCATAGTTPRVTNTVLTKTADLVTARRVATSVFAPEDSIVCYVYFQWDDVAKDAGYHQVEWMWYHDDALVSQTKKRLHFKRTPYTTWTSRAAGGLGTGRFSVATVVDGTEASRSSFDIRP